MRSPTISDVRTTVVGTPWRELVFVEVVTEDGLVGVGGSGRGRGVPTEAIDTGSDAAGGGSVRATARNPRDPRNASTRVASGAGPLAGVPAVTPAAASAGLAGRIS